jgi:hypothetical protein
VGTLDEITYRPVIHDVAEELHSATDRYPPMHSAHEGYAILLEEVDELWEEVRAKQGSRDPERLYKEAIQVAAMAIRFAHDICGERAQR